MAVLGHILITTEDGDVIGFWWLEARVLPSTPQCPGQPPVQRGPVRVSVLRLRTLPHTGRPRVGKFCFPNCGKIHITQNLPL